MWLAPFFWRAVVLISSVSMFLLIFRRCHAASRLICRPPSLRSAARMSCVRAHGPSCGGKYERSPSIREVCNSQVVDLGRRHPLASMAVNGTGVYGKSQKSRVSALEFFWTTSLFFLLCLVMACLRGSYMCCMLVTVSSVLVYVECLHSMSCRHLLPL